jgi:hypothetical protein
LPDAHERRFGGFTPTFGYDYFKYINYDDYTHS